MGLIVTGFRKWQSSSLPSGRDLLEAYLKDGDHSRFQTATLIALHGLDARMLENDSRGESKKEDFDDYIKKYTNLLDDHQLWCERAEFEIAVHDIRRFWAPIRSIPPMITEMCQYCLKTIKISSSVSKADIKAKPSMRHNPQAKTECVCGKQQTNSSNNDRRVCSICQLLVTQLSETPAVFKHFNPEGVAQLTNHIFRDWIVCGACGHGGHTNCMLKWFKTNSYCPFGTCVCCCNSSS